jgi:hypothetical protein
MIILVPRQVIASLVNNNNLPRSLPHNSRCLYLSSSVACFFQLPMQFGREKWCHGTENDNTETGVAKAGPGGRAV